MKRKIMKTFLLILLQSYIIVNSLEVSYNLGLVNINNPERGLYSLKPTTDVEDKITGDTVVPLNQSLYWGVPPKIIFRQYYLPSFRGKALSERQLDLLRSDFSELRKTGRKCILGFAYTSRDTNDAPHNIVLQHTIQLKPVINQFKDVIIAISAGFIGRWGEWAYSNNYPLSDPNDGQKKREFVNHLLSMAPSPIQILIRYIKWKKYFTGEPPTTSSEAISISNQKSRLGHWNACFLVSYNDAGTYGQSVDSYKSYLNEDTKYLLNGGETCEINYQNYSDGWRADCKNARIELPRFHFSFLNEGFYQKIWDAWTAGGCADEIRQNLGYRVTLKRTFISSTDFNINNPSFVLNLRFTIRNTGYAAPINNRPLHLILERNGLAVGVINLSKYNNINIRNWLIESGDIDVSSTVTYAQIVSELGDLNKFIGNYQLKLRLPDTNTIIGNNIAYMFGFSNSGVYDSSKGWNNLNIQFNIFSGTGGTVITPTQTLSPIGCFKDESTRDLPTFWGNNFEKNSCAQKARSVGHRYFGLQYHGECFSGPTYGRYGSAFWTSCLTPCNADSSQFCGGAFANFIYELKTNVLDVEESNLTDDTLEN